MTALSVKKRTSNGRNACRQLRYAGEIPGVIYGEGKDALSVTFSLEEFLPHIKTREIITKLVLDGKEENTVIKEVQYDSLGDDILHVDFHRVSMNKKLTVSIPLEFIGSPKGVKSGGVWDIQMRNLEVSCFPNQIPDKIRVNVENLEIGQRIRVKDINVAKEVTVVAEPELTVVIVTATRVSMAAAATTTETVRTEPERITKEKPEKEEE